MNVLRRSTRVVNPTSSVAAITYHALRSTDSVQPLESNPIFKSIIDSRHPATLIYDFIKVDAFLSCQELKDVSRHQDIFY